MSIGIWGTTTTADGRTVGALRLPAADQSALDSLVGVVNAVRSLKLPGVLRVADLVSHGGRVWLVTAETPGPTVASLLGKIAPTAAAVIATDTARTLLELHAHGLVHGDFDGSTVVLGRSGEALLNEVGIAAALTGAKPRPEDDVAAWAALVSALAPGDAILAAVATAAAAGLETALRVLDANAGRLSDERKSLAALTVDRPGQGRAEQVPAESQTLLRRPAAAADDQAATRLGRRSAAAAAAASPEELRFGRGVPRSTVLTPPPPAQTRPKRRLTGTLSTLLTVALAVVVGVVLWQRYFPFLKVDAAHVSAASVTRCDTNADVTATVLTNGRHGTLTYQWIQHVNGRPGPDTVIPLERTVADGESAVELHLIWSFLGRGDATGTATLRVLSPSPAEAVAQVTYTCH